MFSMRKLLLCLALILSAPAGWAQIDPDLAADCNNITPRGGGRSDHKAINTINLTNLRQSCNLAIRGGFAVRVVRSPGTALSGLLISGNMATAGGANAGGIAVANSPGTDVSGNRIRDLGYSIEQGGTSSGTSAIRLDNSGCGTRCSSVVNNTIERVAFGIEVSNQAGGGFQGDSSGTRITDNRITGASQVTACGSTGCSQGRAIKLQAFGSVPLRNLVVERNKARDFGGRRENVNGMLQLLKPNGSGLDLIGVQNSRFVENIIDGFGDPQSGLGGQNSAAELGLQLRPFPGGQTRGNTFNRNFFRSGYPNGPCSDGCATCGCSRGCADVIFNNQPDQLGLTRTSKGDNSFRNCRF